MKEQGITLIALVITIIVLLILAGVSISAITGENGIVTKAKMAKENTRAAEIQEKINLALAENVIQEETDKEYITKTELVKELLSSNKLTTEESEKLQVDDKVTIGDVEVSFEELSKYSIHFTIDDVKYEAEIGMTWERWVRSDYNTGGFQINERLRHFLDSTGEYWVVYFEIINGYTTSFEQAREDVIEDNKEYYTIPYGEKMADINLIFAI